MPSLKDATKKPANVGDPIEVAAPMVAQRPPAPPYVPNPQGGLATGSMGPAPATFTTPYDSIRQFIRPGVAQNRFPPLPVKANPQSNAVARTIATQVAGSIVSKIELEVPSIFTPIDQTVDLPGPLVVALASETQNTVFAGPVSTAGVGGTDKTVTDTTASSNPFVVTATPSAYPEFAVCGTAQWAGGLFGELDGSWTTVPFGGSNIFGYKDVASGNSVASITGGTPIGAIMTLFAYGGVSPTLVQHAETSVGVSVPGTSVLGFTNPVSAGDTVVVQLEGTGASGAVAGTITITDSLGNVYTNLGTIDVSPSFRYFITQWCCISVTGGSLTITAIVTGGGTLSSIILGIAEFTSITKIITTSTPTFRALVDADLPIVDIPHGGTGLAVLPAHNVLLGEGVAAIAGAAPNTSGYYLKDNGPGVDPSFAALPTSFYQTVEQATVAKTQRPILNFIAPITATDDAGNTSTDIAIPVFVGSGATHAIGLVPDPGASAGTTKFLCEDATWKAAGGSGTALEINGVGVSSDKQFYFNGVADVVSVWGVQINGASG